NRRFAVVIALGDYVGDRFLHPFGWLICPQLVEHQDFGFEYRRQDSKLRRVSIRVVAVLNFFQQIPKVVKERRNTLVDEPGQYRGGQVGLADPARAYEEQANVDHRILVHILSRYHQGPLDRRTSDLEVVKAAALVPRRYVGAAQKSL